MISKKHFPNAIYTNRNAKLSPAADGKAHFAHKIFAVAKISINLVPAMLFRHTLTFSIQVTCSRS